MACCRVIDKKQLQLCEQVQVTPQARAGPSTSYGNRRRTFPSSQHGPNKRAKGDGDKVMPTSYLAAGLC